MKTSEKIDTIREFIEWRDANNDVSSLEVSLEVYAEKVRQEFREENLRHALRLLKIAYESNEISAQLHDSIAPLLSESL